jgi:hypothetical protein
LPVIAAGRFTRYEKLNFFPLVLFETAPIRIPEAFGNSIGDAMSVEDSIPKFNAKGAFKATKNLVGMR